MHLFTIIIVATSNTVYIVHSVVRTVGLVSNVRVLPDTNVLQDNSIS